MWTNEGEFDASVGSFTGRDMQRLDLSGSETRVLDVTRRGMLVLTET